jgi:hypothetical protein
MRLRLDPLSHRQLLILKIYSHLNNLTEVLPKERRCGAGEERKRYVEHEYVLCAQKGASP